MDDFGKTAELIAAGEAATRAALPKIKRTLAPPDAVPVTHYPAYR